LVIHAAIGETRMVHEPVGGFKGSRQSYIAPSPLGHKTTYASSWLNFDCMRLTANQQPVTVEDRAFCLACASRCPSTASPVGRSFPRTRVSDSFKWLRQHLASSFITYHYIGFEAIF
jgi:hypothetical protein